LGIDLVGFCVRYTKQKIGLQICPEPVDRN